ncbi:MAG: activator of (R)-2-hydroxyglutaryl-CoA dehydratase [Bacteroidetes bacterium]|nr:activator of (R)-2-hydroxyglutaryl-CoA dehydratase [Bacteroidota bacterium]
MHDTVRNAHARQEGDGIDPEILAALRSGKMTIEDAVALERRRLERESGLAPRKGHWQRPSERPFFRTERETTTVLFGGLTWKHERLIQANLLRLGYRAEYLSSPDVRAFEIGKEFGNNGLCNPTYFTVGNLIAFLQNLEKGGMSRSEIIDRYVFFTAGACGPCRFGMYESEYRLALHNAGFDGFRVLILQQDGGLDQGSDNAGLEMNLDFTLGILNAFLVADLLNDVAYKLRPYEIEEGSTDRALEEAMEHVAARIELEAVYTLPAGLARLPLLRRHRRGAENLMKFLRQLFASPFPELLRECKEIMAKVRVDRTRVKPVVKITGEFWAQTTEGDGNFRMFSFLEQEGAEVLIEPVAPWLLYLLHQEKQWLRDRRLLDVAPGLHGWARLRAMARSLRGYARKSLLLGLAERLYAREYQRLRARLDYLPQDIPKQPHLQRLGHPYYHSRIEGGEGHLEVAKNIYYSRERLAHMVLSVKPFGCLPSTQSDGVQTAVVAHHDDIIFLPVETSGEGEVNAHSRVQMTLNDARERAKKEFHHALEESGMTEEDFRSRVQAHPEWQQTFVTLPLGVAGTAARLVRKAAAGNTTRIARKATVRKGGRKQ